MDIQLTLVYGSLAEEKWMDQELQTLIDHGINRKTSSVCGFYGEEKECEDMSSGSFFLSKLNNHELNQPQIGIYNIIGKGCDTDGEDGDGVVTVKSAYLETAQNYYMSGNCTAFPPQLVHTDMIHPDKYPETLSILKQILKEKN